MRIERNNRRAHGRDAGFTVLELAISLATTAILVAISYGAFREYARSTVVHKAAVQVAADVGLARSHAIQLRDNVSLVATTAARQYVVRDTAGTVFTRRDFGTGSEFPLDTMAVSTGGDSLTFNSRGLLVGGTGQVVVGREARTKRIQINGLGRTAVN